MEGTPLYTSSDQESSFDTKKSKKQKRFESEPEDSKLSLNQGRHIAREALRHEETKKPAPLFALPEFMSSKPKEESSSETKASEEGAGLDEEEKQYAAQALRRENRRQRSEISTDGDTPPVIAAGDLLVDEWDDRIEAGQDFDEALAEILQEHDIPTELFDDASEAEPDWVPEASPLSRQKTEYARDFSDDEVVINPHQEPTGRPPAEDADIGSRPSPDKRRDATPPPAESGKKQTAERNHDSPAIPALVRGITDNFANRRRSAKSEEKPQPNRDKIEKQVDELGWELKAKEARIRQVAAEHVQRKGPAILETMKAESAKTGETRAEEDAVEIGPVAPLIANQARDRRQRAPEANQLHGNGEASGHIGHVLITAEAANRSRELPKELKARERIELPPSKRIETLSRPELLSLSGQITVEGSSLRQIYETHLIGEQALRRVVAEYLHGGNVKKVLQREIVEHEIDFERDPALRDIAVPAESENDDAKKVVAPGKEALHQLLEKAEAGITDTSEDFTYDKAGADKDMERPGQQPGRREPVDTVMGVIIVVLVILVAILYFWHH